MNVGRLKAAVLFFDILTSEHLVGKCDMIIDSAGNWSLHVVYAL